MHERLETELRGVLIQQSASVSAEAIGRITNTNYQPRTGWLTPWRTAGAVAGVGVVGGVVSTAVLLAGTTPAFAGWTAVPESGQNVPSVAADDSCQSRLSALPTAPGTNTLSGNWSPVVTDVRGPYTLAVFEDQGVYGTCITGPSMTEASVSGPNGGGTSHMSGSISMGGSGQEGGSVQRSSSTVSGGGYGSSGVKTSTQSHLDSPSGSYTIMQGQVSSDVTGITLFLNDGTNVDTTIGGGWFLAWWPNDESAVSAEVTTPNGTTTQALR
jgi:hypothetical protein